MKRNLFTDSANLLAGTIIASILLQSAMSDMTSHDAMRIHISLDGNSHRITDIAEAFINDADSQVCCANHGIDRVVNAVGYLVQTGKCTVVLGTDNHHYLCPIAKESL